MKQKGILKFRIKKIRSNSKIFEIDEFLFPKPRPNNGQHGRPSRPVCGSEPADLSDLDGRPRRPSRPRRPT
ncbi:hypothetical protein BpHYR1_024076 [Brachionus plicatilis]|uniref:Uncharacterized protein n=1 Tax=Brachionus plicatilis TaxID=10195 RepID=A0A3M7QDK1_BRAPC|nr:hypothetical protein BpHYR1_024076 [Brachionus plicatilis]